MISDLMPIGKGVHDINATLINGFKRENTELGTGIINQYEDNKAKEAARQAKGIESNRELLATPGKLESMVSSSMEDVFPFVKKPSQKGEELHTHGIDQALKDHPFAGSATAIKEKFKNALADPKYAGVNHNILLDAVKKDHLNQLDADGKSLITKAHEYKYDKDNGLFRFFSDKGDPNTVALPGYDKYKADEKAKHPYDSSLAESVAFNVGATAVMGGLGVLTGGAVPTAAAIALRLAGAAAVAYPEFKLFDAAANEVAKSRTNPTDPSSGDLLGELAVGAAGLMIGHKVVGAGMGKALATAMKHESTADAAAAIAGYSGKAPEALASYRAAKGAKEALATADNLARLEKENLRVAQKSKFLNELDTVVNPEESSSALNNIGSTRLNIAPEAAHAMGMDAEMYRAAQKSPSVLYTHLIDEGIDAVHTAVQSGVPQDAAVIQQFNLESALKKMSMLEDGTLTPEMLSAQARKALKVPTMQEAMLGVIKNTKTSSKVGSKIPKYTDIEEALAGRKNGVEELITPGEAFASDGAMPTAGVNSKAVTPSPTSVTMKPADITNAVSQDLGVLGNVIPDAKPKEWIAPKPYDKGREPAKIDTSVAGKDFGKKFAVGAVGATGVTAAAMTSPGNSEAGVFDAAFKAGGKVFNSVAEHAIKSPGFPEKITVVGDRLLNVMKKFDVTTAEFKDLGLDKFKSGTIVTKDELSKIVDEKGFKLGEDVYGISIKKESPPAGTRIYQTGNGWGFEGPDGRQAGYTTRQDAIDAVTDLHISIKDETKFSNYKVIKSTEGVIPNSYREEFVTLENPGVANEEIFGESISTQKHWADPHTLYGDTQNPIGRFRYDIQVQPDGKKVMRVHEFQQGYKDADPNVPQSLKDKWEEITVKKAIARAKAEGVDGIAWSTGEQQRSLYDNALRNVADEARYNPVTKEFAVYKDGILVSGYPKKGIEPADIAEHIGKDPAARLVSTESLHEGKTVHRITDLSMDAKWPGKLYGDFAEGTKVNRPWQIVSKDSMYLPIDESSGIQILNRKGKWEVNGLSDFEETELMGSGFASKEDAIAFLEKDFSRVLPKDSVQGSGQFNDKATIPSLLKKHSKGEFGVNTEGQPTVWLNKDTPTNFTLYSHPATVLGVGLTAGALAFQANGGSDGATLAINVQDKVAEKSVMSKIVDFLLPTSAEASPLSASGAVVSKVVGETLVGKSGKAVTSLLEEIFGKGYVGLPVAPGQVVMNAPMKQVVTAPLLGRTVGAFNKTVGKTTTFMDGLVNSVNSPNFFASVYGTVEHKITNQMASMQTAIAHDTESGVRVLSNILKPALGEEKAGLEIAAKMKPIQDAYNEVALPLRAIEIETNKAQAVIKNLKETLGSGSNDAEILGRIAEEEGKLVGLTQEYATYSKQLPEVEKGYADAKHELLTTYKTSRISFAVEEPALMKDARYASLYTPQEKAAVQQITDMLEYYKARAVDAGMPVLDKAYIRHSMDKTKLNEAFAERLKIMGIHTDSKNISLSTFLERSKYSKQMIPDVQRNMLEYIPDAERRINVAKLWDVKNENGWHAFSQNELIKGNKVWNDFFDKMKKAYNPQENTLMNDLVNKYTSIETLRLLFLAPSAAFKHLFKNEGTWATLGFVNSMKHIPEAAEIASRNAVNESFYRLGLDSKIGDRSQRDLFARAITKQRHMLNPLDGMEKDPGVVSKVDEWLQKVNNVGGIGIQAVEAFDRTHTVLAALDMAAKKGMTAEQAMASIYDTILKNNFLGGGLNPEWMRNPKVRALMLFQGTPFKIMERRLMNGMALGSDVKTAWGVIKNQNLEANLAELQGIGTAMLEGQNAFKQHMIYDALTAHKDAYGSSISAQFVREAVIVGGVIAGGSAVGMDFHKHSVHIPFLKEGSAPELSVNPVTAAAYKTAFGPIGQDDKTFFPARFLQNYVKTTGGIQPLMLHKFQRLTNNDIPEIYKDSAFKYLFSVPSSK